PPKRTVWHALFAALVLERHPRGFDVLVDVPLSLEPQRADLLLLRKRHTRGRPAAGAVLRGLWPKLGSDTLVEFKSAARPLRRGDLIRLLGYGAQYHAQHAARLDRGELGLVLVVPKLSRTLDDELRRLGWRLGAGAGGYHPIEGGPYRGWVVVLEQVGRAEHDEVLAPFVHAKVPNDDEAWGWWQQRLWGPDGGAVMPNVANLEGYDELVARMLSRVPPSRLGRVLAMLPAKTRAALPAKALAALPAETLAALPAETLAALPAEALAALPAETRVAGLSLEERLAGLSAEEIEAFVARHKRTPNAGAKAKPRRRNIPR
ncbi:MAG TPA: hypothetical protein VFS43_41420, partial [Polyangiaceae bacterium]|nr:hypothetical protein [Polyangiaceae bacterium]